MKLKTSKDKIIYYYDELNDDFMENGLKKASIPESHKYKRTNKFNNFFSDWLYFGIAKPLLRLGNFFMGVKYVNAKALKEVRKEGCFIYANHTNPCDAFMIQAGLIKRKRCNLIALSDSYSSFVLRHVGRALGYLPIPDNFKTMKNFIDGINFYIKEEHQDILIFPEAHLWPYYNDIRPFKSVSFRYPAQLNAPVIPIVTVYRKPKHGKKPKVTLVVGNPIRPKEGLTELENKEYLRDECYKEMCEIVKKYNSYEYIHYEKVDDIEKKTKII